MPGPDLDAERGFAARILRDEAEAVAALADCLDTAFHEAVALIVACADSGGNVLVTGLGKSGLVGAKISATLASLGIPSHPVHPSEAAHGDLGRFRAADVCIALSFSGETDEVVNLAAVLHQDALPIISITGNDAEPGALEKLATVALRIGPLAEAGEPEFVAPTSSTTASMALGDALALAAARRRGFTDADFAKRHPGGALGGLLRPVTDVMRFETDRNLPSILESTPVADALRLAADVERRPGALLVVNDEGLLTGIFTDGDLRRLVLRDPDQLHQPIRNVMSANPRSLPAGALVRDAVRAMREQRQDEIPIVDDQGKPVGILDVQDLVTMKLIRN